MADVIYLLSSEKTQDEFGVWRDSLTKRMVYCEVDSVTRDEFFEGGRNGLNPQYRMRMFSYDYNGETSLEYNGSTYGIYRTFKAKDDTIELYVERKGGTNGLVTSNG